MPYKLDSYQLRELITQPETGMGYQYVEADMNDYSSLRGVVLNAEIFVPENKIEKIIGKYSLSYSAILREAEQPGYIRKLRVIKKDSIQLGESRYFEKSIGASASEAPLSSTEKYQIFKRFSAYKNDYRVRDDGSLLPGSYATTEEDAKKVRTGTDATLRYALPCDDPAIYIFTISPPEKTAIRIGIVKPANNKPGGGVEVLFENGSPKNSVTGPSIIPAK